MLHVVVTFNDRPLASLRDEPNGQHLNSLHLFQFAFCSTVAPVALVKSALYNRAIRTSCTDNDKLVLRCGFSSSFSVQR